MSVFSISRRVILFALTSAAEVGVAQAQPAAVELLNVSYDPTRALFADFNKVFAAHWKAQTGQTVTIRQSHGGSGSEQRTLCRQRVV